MSQAIGLDQMISADNQPELTADPYTCLADFLQDLTWSVEIDGRRMVMTYTARKKKTLIDNHLRAVECYERQNADTVKHKFVAARMDRRFRAIYVVIELPASGPDMDAYLQRVDEHAKLLKREADRLQVSIEQKIANLK